MIKGEVMENNRRFSFAVKILIALILIGTIGYKFILDVSVIDALYMTVITISTVGYTEVAAMSAAAKLF
jgi:voltage-gated potassium channel